MSDLTPPTLLSLSLFLSSPLLCITHIFLSSCNMTRDSEVSEDDSITAAGAIQIAYGTPEHPSTFFFVPDIC